MPAAELFTDVDGGDASTVQYVFTVNRDNIQYGPSMATHTIHAPLEDGKFFVSQTGEVSITVFKRGNYTAKLEATDKAGSRVTVRMWDFEALYEDTMDTRNGPNGKGCVHGAKIDGTAFDTAFTCNCSATKYMGDN